MLRGGDAALCIHVVRIWAHPTLSLILQYVGSQRCAAAAKVAFDHVQCEVDTGGQASGACEVAALDESGTASDLDVGKGHGQVSVGGVMGRDRFAREQSGPGEQKC